MKLFGIHITTKRGLEAIEIAAHNAAVSHLVDLLRQSDKVHLEPVTLVGDNQVITNCMFLGIKGTALRCEQKEATP